MLLSSGREFSCAFVGEVHPCTVECADISGAWDQVGGSLCPFDVEEHVAGARVRSNTSLAPTTHLPTLDKMYAARNGSTPNCSWACSDSLSSCASGLHEKLDAALSLDVRAIGCAGMTRGGVCDVGGLPGVGLSAIHGPLFVNSEAVHAAGHRPRMKCSAQVIFGATLEST